MIPLLCGNEPKIQNILGDKKEEKGRLYMDVTAEILKLCSGRSQGSCHCMQWVHTSTSHQSSEAAETNVPSQVRCNSNISAKSCVRCSSDLNLKLQELHILNCFLEHCADVNLPKQCNTYQPHNVTTHHHSLW